MSRICRTYSTGWSRVVSVMDELKEWRRKRECGSLKFVQVVVVRCLRAQALSLPSWAGIIDLVSLKSVHSHFNAWNPCASCENVRSKFWIFFSFFKNFCVTNGSDVSVKCYSNSVSERFFLSLSLSFFLCQVELHERVDFSNIFDFKKKFRNH